MPGAGQLPFIGLANGGTPPAGHRVRRPCFGRGFCPGTPRRSVSPPQRIADGDHPAPAPDGRRKSGASAPAPQSRAPRGGVFSQAVRLYGSAHPSRRPQGCTSGSGPRATDQGPATGHGRQTALRIRHERPEPAAARPQGRQTGRNRRPQDRTSGAPVSGDSAGTSGAPGFGGSGGHDRDTRPFRASRGLGRRLPRRVAAAFFLEL